MWFSHVRLKEGVGTHLCVVVCKCVCFCRFLFKQWLLNLRTNFLTSKSLKLNRLLLHCCCCCVGGIDAAAAVVVAAAS